MFNALSFICVRLSSCYLAFVYDACVIKQRFVLSLEESISYYEIGIKLKSHCEKLLKTAELKILKVSEKEKIVTEELQEIDD